MEPDHAFFGVDHGIFAVGSEHHGRQLPLFAVVSQVSGAVLLVGAEDQPHAFFQGDPQILHRFQGEKGCHSRSLIVAGATADELPVSLTENERISQPASSLRNNVQVGEDPQLRIPAKIR